MAAHGGAQGDKVIEMDGMRLGLLLGDTSSTGVSSNDASTQEVTVEVGASSAESTGGGVRVNIIPKEGGNGFHGSLFSNFANKSMTNSNFTDALKATGVTAPDRVNRIYDTSFALGGPLKKDKLWFFTAQRFWGYQNLRADAFYEINPFDYKYDPDPSRQAYDDQTLRSHNLRLTWQIDEKNKLAVFYDYQPRCTCHWTVSSIRPGEATPVQNLPLNWYGTVSYTSAISSRLLFTAGFSNLSTDWTRLPQADGVPIDPLTGRLTSEGYGVQDTALGITYRAYGAPFNYNFSATRNYRAALNYVTGSHQMKFGATMVAGERIVRNWMTASDTELILSNGKPIAIRRYSTPYAEKENLNADLGVFAQDTWRVRRLTLNVGLRFDYMNQSVPAQDAPAGTWVGARQWRRDRQRAELEGSQSAPGHRLRPVRQRQDRDQGDAEPLCGAVGHGLCRAQQPDHDQHQLVDTELERRQRRFHSPAERAERGAESGVVGSPARHVDVRRRRPSRVGRAPQ